MLFLFLLIWQLHHLKILLFFIKIQYYLRQKKIHIMKVVLVNSTPTSDSFLDYNESEIEVGDTSNCLLNLFGKPIITRNLSILGSLCEIEKILIP